MFFDPDQPVTLQRGNCLTAVVASLLELPIEAVPNFVQIDVSGGPDYWTHLNGYLYWMGWEIQYIRPKNPPSGFYTVSGVSTQATESHVIYHICIYKDGKIVHDPNPHGNGLLTEESGWMLIPVQK